MTAILGLLSGFALVIVAIFIGGAPAGFVNAAGILIVLFGTFAVTSVSFSGREMGETPGTVWRMMVQIQQEPSRAATAVIQIAERARRDGFLALERILPTLNEEPFLRKALSLLIDGTKGEEIEQILNREAGAIAARNMKTVDVLRRAGEVAPAMGLIGTLIGLVKMLGTLDDPSSIGPAMSVALLTTFYGAIMAHMVFIPLAARAERLSSDETLLNSVYALGAASMGRKENPRQLELIVNTILPPAQKVNYFD